MVVLVLSAAPASLRGQLTRWLMEVAPGVFVGHVSRRVRDELWRLVVDRIGTGRALLVTPARNEQRMELQSHGHDWTPTDVEGLTLMFRPTGDRGPLAFPTGAVTTPFEGWSIAGRRRKFGSASERSVRAD